MVSNTLICHTISIMKKTTSKVAQKTEIQMLEILMNAINSKDAKLMEAYRAFHNYSLNNQLLAMWQCNSRDLPIGPINTYNGWKEKGRQVKSGEKAIALLMPITRKKEDKEGNEEVKFAGFIERRNWFVMSQTEGEAIENKIDIPEWNKDKVLNEFGIKMIPFELMRGNTQGYSMVNSKEIAINPLAQLPIKTFIHEVAHNVFHNGKDCELSTEHKEVEAESIALLVLECLGLEGGEYARGYIQNWLKDKNEFTETWAKQIITKANKILKAGLPEKEKVKAD